MNWATIQDGLYDAVKAALPSCNVAWEMPGVNPPAKPYALLTLPTRDKAPGLAGGESVVYAATGTGGHDCTATTAHHRRHICRVEVFSNSIHGDAHAASLLAGLSRELAKDARAAALKVAGCKAWMVGDGNLTDLSGLLATRAESRAQCDVTVATLDGTTESVGAIETYDVSGIVVTP